jgi:pimeloyl-ACP methyl ester carboxylesterase
MNHRQFYVRCARIALMFFAMLCCSATESFLLAQTGAAPKKELVILLHGLGRGKSIMAPMGERLVKAGFDVSIVDYSSIGRSPEEILTDAADQINSFRSDTNQTVHFVGHSLGGLLIRAYLDSVNIRTLGRVVLIGSPSKGTPFVDRFRDAWWLQLVGPAATSLGTDEKSFPRTLRPPYYPVGIIAGISTQINNDDFIPGEDDGIVPVESTKIEGMTDFVLVRVSHSSLPKNDSVIQHTIGFLRAGKFLKEDQEKNSVY